jgi:tRNA-(ms[2]io[6]A)-hydroxylase
VAEKRRLPVISSQEPRRNSADPESESRPEWQWVGFGVVAMFAAWLPLAAAAGMFARSIAEGMLGAPLDAADAQTKIAALDTFAQRKLMASYMAPHVVALALAGVFAGFVIGKFGQGGGRAASVAAGIVCVLAGLLAVRDLSSLVALLVVVVVAVLSARGGATWGARRREAGVRG